jgi:hypothetical protein
MNAVFRQTPTFPGNNDGGSAGATIHDGPATFSVTATERPACYGSYSASASGVK